ncbi:MAG: GDP-mannose 4,6-dehydratase, partial [Candidatus Omnitrophica bacterium]|nr:GDP-mannose 4,6-dehydratase [Candidatus Omnitrophota bacterium]
RLLQLVQEIRPNEIYHFGAQSDSRISFAIPAYTTDITGLSTLRLLEAIRRVDPGIRFYQASSCEIFGDAPAPQHEGSSMNPRNPYGAAKLYAYHLARIYRETHGLFCCSGILYNHESHRRGEDHVARKITRGIARILAGEQDTLALGKLGARRDWGYAPDYLEVMWRLLQRDTPEDVVLGTGEDHAVGDFVDVAFGYVGLRQEGRLTTDPQQFRTSDTTILQADRSKVTRLLGWTPRLSFEELVKVLVDVDLQLAGLEVIGEGIEAVKRAGLTWSLAGLCGPMATDVPRHRVIRAGTPDGR